MDDQFWPSVGALSGVNQLVQPMWPQWGADSVYQPLVAVNLTAEYQDNDIQYLPGLATWNTTDSQTYTFNLRQNINFSNGDPLNAYQVWSEMYAFYYLSGNASGWDQSYSVFNMSTSNFGPAVIALMNQSGVVNPSQALLNVMENSSWPIYVTGPYTIVYHLAAPFVYFPGTLTSYNGLIWDVQFVLQHGGFGTPTTPNTYFNTVPIPGTGPYIITQVLTDSYITFAQNPDYWGRNLTLQQISANPILDPGHVKNAIIYYKTDDLARYTDLSTGAAQIAAINTPNFNRILADPTQFGYVSVPAWGQVATTLALNTQRYPTNITDVRQAIAHAINLTQIADEAFFGKLTPFVGPEYPGWKQFYDLGNLSTYSYNITLAEQYLNESKVDVSTLPTLDFEVEPGCQWCVTTAQVIQSDLGQIGLTVNIVVSPTFYQYYGPYSTNLANAQQISQLAYLGSATWAPDALTPADNWLNFVNNQSLYGNWAIYTNPVVQNCVDALTSNSNVTYIQGLCTQAQQQIYNDAPYVWLGINGLWYGGGSLAYSKGTVTSFLLDQQWDGSDTLPFINTVLLGGS